ncbi:MAG: hypothetical protein LBC80_10635 [Treponema sp.]|jgi:hypothetical protein|nr:hypothetical protein [Treponema sp.]
MKNFAYKTTILLFGLCLAILTSCVTRLNASLEADGSAVFNVNASLQRNMAALIQRLFSAAGQEGQALNGPAIARSMSNAPGVTSVSLRNTASAAVEGQIQVSQINEFLTSAGGNSFINYEQGQSGGRCEITINLDNGPEIIELLSLEIYDYLNALMAPVVTGEELRKNEYLELVASFYNRAISNEITSSRIIATIDFPAPVTGIKGGTFSGRRATFDIPLLDLLVLEEPVVLEVRW